MKNSLRTTFLHLGIISGVFGLDQISKYLARNFNLAVLNPNFAFDWFFNLPLMTLSLAILIFIWWLGKQKNLSNWGKDLIMAGALSNLLDRWVFGGVWDWLPIPILSGLNNMADWSIIFGLLSVLVLEYKKNKNR